MAEKAMKNLNKKPKNIDLAKVDAVTRQVEKTYRDVKGQLGKPLTSKMRLRLPKVRRSGQSNVPTILSLTEANSALLPIGRTSQELKDKQLLLRKLKHLLGIVTGFQVHTSDAVLSLESELFQTALDICTISERGKADQGVVAVVSKMRADMAYGPRDKTKVVKVPVKESLVPAEAAPELEKAAAAAFDEAHASAVADLTDQANKQSKS